MRPPSGRSTSSTNGGGRHRPARGGAEGVVVVGQAAHRLAGLFNTCFPCHQKAKDHNPVFTRYAP
jgi:hypothetical protein